MINSAATISWGTMLADVLNAPIAELTMSNNVDTGKDLLNARALSDVSMQQFMRYKQHTLSSSRQFSKMF